MRSDRATQWPTHKAKARKARHRRNKPTPTPITTEETK